MPVYISEIYYKGGILEDWVEIAAPTGTDTSGYSLVYYSGNGKVDGTTTLGAVVSTFDGQDVYLVDDTDPAFPSVSNNGAVALVDDTGTVIQFISFGGNTVTATEGPADGLTSTSVGTADEDETLQSDDGGLTYYSQTTPNPGTIPCYAPGTMIDTPDGPRAVETLLPCDLVMTLDHGPQPIKWVRAGDQPLEHVDPDAKPVLIKAGALGRNLPAQDMIVSPQHRILVGGAGQLQTFFASEAFAPAKSLTSLPGIRHMMGRQKIVWHHFACDRHEIVVANGCLSESLLLGPMVMRDLSENQRDAVYEIFRSDTQSAALNGPPARPCLKVGEVRRMLKKIGRKQLELV